MRHHAAVIPAASISLEPDLDGAAPPADAMAAHDMNPEVVLRLLSTLGGSVGRVLIVGCEPEHVVEKIGLSRTAEQTVETALVAVRDIINELLADADARLPAAAAEGGTG